MNTIKKIFKSWAVWVSLLSVIGLIVVNTTGCIDNDTWQIITNLILSLISAFGIVNNPNTVDGLGYADNNEVGDYNG